MNINHRSNEAQEQDSLEIYKEETPKMMQS